MSNIMKKKLRLLLFLLITAFIASACTTISTEFGDVDTSELVSDIVGYVQDANELLSDKDSSEIVSDIMGYITGTNEMFNGTEDSNSSGVKINAGTSTTSDGIEVPNITFNDIPEYSGASIAVINKGIPLFKKMDYTESFEYYSELDDLGRCGTCFANVGKDLMPTEERGAIGSVKPTGWHTVKYDCVEGKYLYNRCHLLGFQLTGENANVRNLITGTRYLNIVGMLEYENEIANYVEKTGNHVLYRVTPVYEGNNLVCHGLLMEAQSIEDDRVQWCVFAYNVQPGVYIDYATGESYELDKE